MRPTGHGLGKSLALGPRVVLLVTGLGQDNEVLGSKLRFTSGVPPKDWISGMG